MGLIDLDKAKRVIMDEVVAPDWFKSVVCMALSTLKNVDPGQSDFIWHDLRRNPSDVPISEGRYRVAFQNDEALRSGDYNVLFYNPGYGWCDEHYDIHTELDSCDVERYLEQIDEEEVVIAWQEIDFFIP